MRKLFVLLLVAPMLTACGIEQVDEGYRGIKQNWGKVVGEPLEPGLYFYNPVSETIFEMKVREQKGTGSTQSFTKDTQNVSIQYAVTYFAEPKKIGELYKQFGRDWMGTLLSPAVLAIMKDQVGQYEADDLIAKREAVQLKVEETLRNEMDAHGIKVKNLFMTNLDFNDAYEAAVEAKVVAIQQALEAKNKTVRVKEEAKQQIETAKAVAESMRIRAKALTQNKALVEYEAVQRWDGKLPQYMIGGGATPFIDLRKMNNQQ